MHNPKLMTAVRFESDCWNALVKHTNACKPCLAARHQHHENGLGCDIGRMCKDEWIIASRRRCAIADAGTRTESVAKLSMQAEGKR